MALTNTHHCQSPRCSLCPLCRTLSLGLPQCSRDQSGGVQVDRCSGSRVALVALVVVMVVVGMVMVMVVMVAVWHGDCVGRQ